ncbi:MAG: DUF1549 domain-containing protein [Pirellula sp.]|nr:DUF1549 domain-containing protein [Pirellula sp.]
MKKFLVLPFVILVFLPSTCFAFQSNNKNGSAPTKPGSSGKSGSNAAKAGAKPADKPKSQPAKPSVPKPGTTKLEKTELPAAVTTKGTKPPFSVAVVDTSNRSAIEEAAAKIDAILEKDWTNNSVQPQPPLKDEQFLRRIYLQLGGRIPTVMESGKFLTSKSETKRQDLIDELLATPDYVSHTYNYWADILRLTEKPNNNIILDPYLAYVKESIAQNKPYDKWVHEMLTANGKVWDNPAVGFQIRDDGMPLPYVDNTVKVFLGKQIGCAQCHDHPFDSWTQKQFYELAALTAGTRTRLNKNDPEMKKGGLAPGDLIKQARDKAPDGKIKGPFQNLVQANSYSVQHANRPLKLPHDYQYSDGKPNEVVTPKVLWGKVPDSAAKADRREQFATWMTVGNRQFAKNIANRIWKRMMGLGVVEPIDDFRDDNKPSNPELLEHLTDEIVRLNFDTRELMRIIAYTSAFQRLAIVHDPSSTETFRFAGPVLRRMTAEQIWDSLITLVAYNPWSFQRPSAKELAPVVDIDWSSVNLAMAQSAADKYEATYAPATYNKERQLLSGFEGQLLVRASEIPTPLPLGHFLRQFGQSDRESIEGGRTVATVPQILAMFNGPITHIMLKKGSVIYDNVVSAGPAQAVDVMFMAILTHRPTPLDRDVALKEIRTADSVEAGYGNVLWALLNTREFLFIQ